tara:strand:- start:4942 stop:7143 length:2202 start_codon:yes stop_codon:yes gene_type:complete
MFQLISLIQFQTANASSLLNPVNQLGYIGSFFYKNSIILFGNEVSRLFWFMSLCLILVITFKQPLSWAKKCIKYILYKLKEFIIATNSEISKSHKSNNFQKKLIHTLFFTKKEIKKKNSKNMFDDFDFKDTNLNQKKSTKKEIKQVQKVENFADRTFELPKSLANISQPILDNPLDQENILATNQLVEKTQPEDTPKDIDIKEKEDESLNSITINLPVEQETKKEIKTDQESEILIKTDSEIDEESYKFPPIAYLKQSSTKVDSIKNQTKKRVEQAAILEEALQSFNVKAKVINITPGPSVTRFELQPGEGVKISKITGLSKDIALKLAAPDIRIEAPIPGKALIGIEVPNSNIQMITLRSIMQETDFYSKPALSAGMGKTISGECILMDLAKMPHVLIAGATGSGKSVCINTIILSILMKAHPNDVKFLMIDPKKVELSLYDGIPHLVAPVVTDPNKAAATLKKWALVEMERRYEIFSKVGVKDLPGYNKYVEENKEKIELGKELDNSNEDTEETESLSKMPYIVVIIDELADLMMVAAQDVEQTICRLAQMARATGIHLVIATQRPSVNVVTGLIKANVPSRISFYLQSQIDSRTILDMAGAEKLMGKGDMLYSPSGTFKPTRIQGVFVSEEEVKKVVSHLKDQAKPDYLNEIIEVEPLTKEDSSSKKSSDVDELYEDAKQLIISTKYASTSYLQRKLRIGYNRAARIMDELETQGVISEYVGEKKARQVT